MENIKAINRYILVYDVLGEILMSEENYKNMYHQIENFFPKFGNNQIRYFCNLISHELRKLHQDIYEVNIQKTPFLNEQGYYAYFDVKMGNEIIYVQVTVD